MGLVKVLYSGAAWAHWRSVKALRDPIRLIPVLFLAAIAIGTVLLSLPFATVEGVRAPLLTALFTSTSAVAVTGLIVVDTPTYWSGFGQGVILLLFQVGLAEHDAHEVALLDADPMLAGQNAAHPDAEAQDFGAEFLGFFQFARRIGVIEDQRMQVAVAGVKYVGDGQAVLGGKLGYAGQNLGQPGPGNGAVHAVIIG